MAHFCYRVRFPRAGDAFHRRDLIPAGEDLFDRRLLALAQMWMVFLDFPAPIEAGKRSVFVLPVAHELDRVLLVADHFARSERAAWCARFLLYSNELTGM